MSVAILEGVDFVDIDQHEAEGQLLALGAAKFLLQSGVETASADQPDQAIAIALRLSRRVVLVGRLARGDVAQRREDTAIVGQVTIAGLEPDAASVLATHPEHLAKQRRGGTEAPDRCLDLRTVVGVNQIETAPAQQLVPARIRVPPSPRERRTRV